MDSSEEVGREGSPELGDAMMGFVDQSLQEAAAHFLQRQRAANAILLGRFDEAQSFFPELRSYSESRQAIVESVSPEMREQIAARSREGVRELFGRADHLLSGLLQFLCGYFGRERVEAALRELQH